MRPWRQTSRLTGYVADDPEFPPPPTAVPLAERTVFVELLQQLKYLTRYLHGKDHLISAVKMLHGACSDVWSIVQGIPVPARSRHHNVKRLWHYISPAIYAHIGAGDPDFLLVVAYFEATTACLRGQVPGSPTYGQPISGKMKIIQRIHRVVEETAGAKMALLDDPVLRAKVQTYRSLMELPLRLASGYQEQGTAFFVT